MGRINTEHGVGMVEVLVSLVILSTAVLGYAALQIRALDASLEASNNVQAMNLARDLGERMRMNREGLNYYKNLGADEDQDDGDDEESSNCSDEFCNPEELAKFDYAQVGVRANDVGMKINVLSCPQSTLSRLCVYVAWEDTLPVNDTDETACTNGVAYHQNAKCIMMEVLNDL